jgi:hypothetical protein
MLSIKEGGFNMRTLALFLGAAALAAFSQPACAQASVTGASQRPSAIAPAPLTPAATAAITTLDQVCLPLLQGQSLKAISVSTGLKNKDGQWILPIADKRAVTLDPPDAANPHVCGAEIPYRAGSGDAVLVTVDEWAKAQAPPLRPDKIRVQSTQGSELVTTSSWTGHSSKGAEALVLCQKDPIGGQAANSLKQATLLVSLTPS